MKCILVPCGKMKDHWYKHWFCWAKIYITYLFVFSLSWTQLIATLSLLTHTVISTVCAINSRKNMLSFRFLISAIQIGIWWCLAPWLRIIYIYMLYIQFDVITYYQYFYMYIHIYTYIYIYIYVYVYSQFETKFNQIIPRLVKPDDATDMH